MGSWIIKNKVSAPSLNIHFGDKSPGILATKTTLHFSGPWSSRPGILANHS